MLIKKLLEQFNISLGLPEEILNTQIEGHYDKMSQEELTLEYINKYGIRDYGVYKCYVFESDNFKVFICPSNFYSMLGIYKRLGELFVGATYNFKGELVGVS